MALMRRMTVMIVATSAQVRQVGARIHPTMEFRTTVVPLPLQGPLDHQEVALGVNPSHHRAQMRDDPTSRANDR